MKVEFAKSEVVDVQRIRETTLSIAIKDPNISNEYVRVITSSEIVGNVQPGDFIAGSGQLIIKNARTILVKANFIEVDKRTLEVDGSLVELTDQKLARMTRSEITSGLNQLLDSIETANRKDKEFLRNGYVR
jgi:hypothetical protein